MESDTKKLSAYVIDQTLMYLVNNQHKVIDRQHLKSIDQELNYQDGGNVDDSLAKWRGHQDAPDIIMIGSLKDLGAAGYHLTLTAVDVSSAEQRASFSKTLRADPVLGELLKVNLDVLIKESVAELGENIHQKTVIRTGRISHLITDSVTSFSQYMANQINDNAARLTDTFQVITDVRVPVAAQVRGAFNLQEGDKVAVTLRLISEEDGGTLGTSRFIVPLQELTARGTSVLPPNIAEDVHARRTQAVSQYDNVEDQFGLTVTVDRGDAIYHDGDFMTFTVSAEKDCYIKVTHVDVAGNVQTIYPIGTRQNNFIPAGETKKIPDTGRFRLTQPYGEETILIAAYEERFELENGATVLPVSNEEISKSLKARGIQATADELEPAAARKFNYSILEK
jgi:hypothetical protein